MLNQLQNWIIRELVYLFIFGLIGPYLSLYDLLVQILEVYGELIIYVYKSVLEKVQSSTKFYD